jgi:hypothetical protein
MTHGSIRRVTRWVALLFVVVLITGALFSGSQAQTPSIYFAQTGHYLGGAFRSFWESNGALANFGYPITPEYVSGAGRVTQYFERARFELTEVNGQAVVELGKLGVEMTGGRAFPKVPPIRDTADRLYFPQTQHIVQYGFKEIWETRGGERIFGLPISEEIKEVVDDGEWRTVQYFERVRFEYWPEFAPSQRVLISNLGRRLAPPELMTPQSPSQPPAGPSRGAPAPAPVGAQQPLPIPPSVNARVAPESGPPGTTFSFDANGFDPGERVGVWLTAPDQAAISLDIQPTADGSGSIAGANIRIATDLSFSDGIWSFNAQGINSQRQAIGYFRISRAGIPPGDPNKLGVIIHDQLPVQGDVLILPVAAPSGTMFAFAATGYQPDERVGSWISDVHGQSWPINEADVFLDNGFVRVLFNTAGLADGVYTVVAQGVNSGLVSTAAFKLTRDYVAGPGTPRPPSVNGSATPPEGGIGSTIQLRGQNLLPNEELEFWATDPNGIYLLFPIPLFADNQGRIGYDPPLDATLTNEVVSGVYGFHFRGTSSGTRVDIYFTVNISSQARQIPDSGLRMIQQLAGQGRLPAWSIREYLAAVE